jgi:RNA polymerase sigma-70 factor, ECF subfamily
MEANSLVADDQILRLVARCQDGDMLAVEELYGLCASRLFRYFVARTADPEASSDLVGELFVRVLKHLGRFRPNPDCPAASFTAWIYRIAANLVTDHWRGQTSRRDAELCDEYSAPARGADPHWWAEQRETNRRIAGALAGLTEEQRLVILGKFGEGMSNQEIATWLGKTEGGVKSLQHRALHALAQSLRRRDA